MDHRPQGRGPIWVRKMCLGTGDYLQVGSPFHELLRAKTWPDSSAFTINPKYERMSRLEQNKALSTLPLLLEAFADASIDQGRK